MEPPRHPAAQLAEVEEIIMSVSKSYRQHVQDTCDDDDTIRKLARPHVNVEGDSYGIPTIVCIVESLVTKLEEVERVVKCLPVDIEGSPSFPLMRS